ncbi:SDR family NAD(P)-dependent oxidoreductase [Cellulosimicrobium sp. Marseille-Q8652]
MVLAGRSPDRLDIAASNLREHVPGASPDRLVVDLASSASVRAAGSALAAYDRLDGLLLNGGSMALRATDRTPDGLPTLVATHVVANVALVAHALPAMARTGAQHGPARVVHTSSGFVDRLRRPVTDVLRTSRVGVVAYTRAKAATEVFALELARRLDAAGVPVESLVARPGVGVDARTPHRTGIRDETVPVQRNPFTPWAQGKDTAAWSAVRALTDPHARGGQVYAPADGPTGSPGAGTPLGADRLARARRARGGVGPGSSGSRGTWSPSPPGPPPRQPGPAGAAVTVTGAGPDAPRTGVSQGRPAYGIASAQRIGTSRTSTPGCGASTIRPPPA